MNRRRLRARHTPLIGTTHLQSITCQHSHAGDRHTAPGLELEPDRALGATGDAAPAAEASLVNQMQCVVFQLPSLEEATPQTRPAAGAQCRVGDGDVPAAQLLGIITFLLRLAERKTTAGTAIAEFMRARTILEEELVNIPTLSGHPNDAHRFIRRNHLGLLAVLFGGVLEQYTHLPFFTWAHLHLRAAWTLPQIDLASVGYKPFCLFRRDDDVIHGLWLTHSRPPVINI
jgi:hypothetical protein